MIHFNSQICYRGSFVDTWDEEQIKNEPMLFNCDLEGALRLGGPITHAFLAALPEDWQSDVVIDSRVHMLMPGWTPCIPGWHHDDVPRGGSNNQPIYDRLHDAEHLMGLVNGDIAATRFLVGPVVVSEAHSKALVYKEWSQEINRQIATGSPNFKVMSAPSGRLIQFDCYAFHTGVPAIENGWRWFIRVSRKSQRLDKPLTNELRRQVQVYMEFPEQGW